MTAPKITVLMPTFNRAGTFLRESLDSILSQTLPAHQIIVINDCSADDTPAVCASYGQAIEYMESKRQLGRPGAINLGLEKVAGDYVWIFDDDDVAMPDALERFVEPLEKDTGLGFSYSSFYFTGTQKGSHKLGEIMGELTLPDVGRKGFLISLLEWNFLGGASLFARSSCYRKVGFFDPELLRSQDYEMAIRIARQFKGVRVPGGPAFYYRQHGGLRGSARDSFAFEDRKSKWLEYDQIFFRKLYKEIPLAEYGPPGDPLGDCRRQALLMRMSIMARKLLFTEVILDLQKMAELGDLRPFTPQEYLIIRSMIVDLQHKGMDGLFDHVEFFDHIRRLARSSTEMRLLRAKISRALLAHFRKNRDLNVLSRFFHLYFSG